MNSHCFHPNSNLSYLPLISEDSLKSDEVDPMQFPALGTSDDVDPMQISQPY